MEHSDEVYTILKQPFASVSDFLQANLKIDKAVKDGISLEIVFNPKGAKDIQKGTGDPLHPHIAVVVANKLLYVALVDGL